MAASNGVNRKYFVHGTKDLEALAETDLEGVIEELRKRRSRAAGELLRKLLKLEPATPDADEADRRREASRRPNGGG